MPRYKVVWTEITEFISEVDAESAEAAEELCLNNQGDWQDCIDRGYDYVVVEEVNA